MRYQTLTPIIGDFPEISVTLICLPLTAEDLPSIWTCWLPELRGKLPLRQAMRWDELASSLASKLKRTGLPQNHYPIIFWIIFPDTRFGKKNEEERNEEWKPAFPNSTFSQICWYFSQQNPDQLNLLTVSNWTHISEPRIFSHFGRKIPTEVCSLFSTAGSVSLSPWYRYTQSLGFTNQFFQGNFLCLQ